MEPLKEAVHLLGTPKRLDSGYPQKEEDDMERSTMSGEGVTLSEGGGSDLASIQEAGGPFPPKEARPDWNVPW